MWARPVISGRLLRGERAGRSIGRCRTECGRAISAEKSRKHGATANPLERRRRPGRLEAKVFLETATPVRRTARAWHPCCLIFRREVSAMPRAIWKGAISFGLVTVPVGLFAATERAAEIRFRLLHAKDASPIDYKRVCEAEGVEVPWAEIV